MKDVKLSYEQLRQILALSISNGVIKTKIEDLIAGKLASVNEMDLLALITESEVDKDLIRILSGKDPETMDALAGLEYISAFFAYWASNKKRFSDLLASTGLKLQASTSTGSKASK